MATRAALLALLLVGGAAAASAACTCAKGAAPAYTAALRSSGKNAFWEPARFPLHNATAEYDFSVSEAAWVGPSPPERARGRARAPAGARAK
jgi:hypothetical protein